MVLSEPNEDYLERIAELIDQKGYARVTDIAEALHVTPASVTNMVQKLEQLGYIEREHYRGLILTTKGKKVGAKLRERHAILEEFLTLLKIPRNVIEEDVEGLEHHLSDETVEAIKKLIEKLKSK